MMMMMMMLRMEMFLLVMLMTSNRYRSQLYTTITLTDRYQRGCALCLQVQTGFGRLGSHYWGFESQGVVPDMGQLTAYSGRCYCVMIIMM